VLIVLKFGSFNLLEPSRLVQACNGIALPLPATYNEHSHGQTFKEIKKTRNSFLLIGYEKALEFLNYSGIIKEVIKCPKCGKNM